MVERDWLGTSSPATGGLSSSDSGQSPVVGRSALHSLGSVCAHARSWGSMSLLFLPTRSGWGREHPRGSRREEGAQRAPALCPLWGVQEVMLVPHLAPHLSHDGVTNR